MVGWVKRSAPKNGLNSLSRLNGFVMGSLRLTHPTFSAFSHEQVPLSNLWYDAYLPHAVGRLQRVRNSLQPCKAHGKGFKGLQYLPQL
jgi:hypothetical protein